MNGTQHLITNEIIGDWRFEVHLNISGMNRWVAGWGSGRCKSHVLADARM